MKPILLVVLLALVTYAPRLLPFLLALRSRRRDTREGGPTDAAPAPHACPSPAGESRFSTRRIAGGFFAFIPPAVLGAMIFPGVLDAGGGDPYPTIAGAVAAAAVSFLGWGLAASVVAAVGVTFVAMLLF